MLYPTKLKGLNNFGIHRLSQDAGLSELIAQSNGIRNLAAAKIIALQKGCTQIANTLEQQIQRLINEGAGILGSHPYIIRSLYKQLTTLENANKKDTARYLGMLSHLDDNQALFPDGVPVIPQLKNVYQNFLQNANNMGLKLFSQR